MNKKGFTLIELLGVIIILAALALVAFPAILSVLNGSQNEVDSSVIKFIKSAAEECVNDNINDKTKCDNVDKLKNNGYISTTFYKKYPDIKNKTITITKNGKKYCYGYDIINGDVDYNNCID